MWYYSNRSMEEIREYAMVLKRFREIMKILNRRDAKRKIKQLRLVSTRNPSEGADKFTINTKLRRQATIPATPLSPRSVASNNYKKF